MSRCRSRARRLYKPLYTALPFYLCTSRAGKSGEDLRSKCWHSEHLGASGDSLGSMRDKREEHIAEIKEITLR